MSSIVPSLSKSILLAGTALVALSASAFAQLGPIPPASMKVTPFGGTAQRTLVSKLGDVLSLLDFGAVCDGTTDDSASIAAANISGRRITIPAGRICNGASISQAGIVGMFVGPGQIKTSDGNLRGPFVSQITTAPVRGPANITQGMNGTLTGVPIAIEQRITGAATLGQPTTGYMYTNEVGALYVSMYNESGYNNSTGPASGTSGRTGFGAINVDLSHNGQGDASAFQTGIFVNGPNVVGATSVFANPAATMLSGSVTAGHSGVFLQGIGDLNLIDGGYDVAAYGSTINLNRTNGTGALGASWVGYRVQNGGTVNPDAAFSASGGYKIGLDLADAYGTTAAIAMLAGQRVYGNSTQPNATPTPATVSLGTEWYDYSATNGWEFYVGGVSQLSFGTANDRFTAGPGQTNTGVGSSTFGGYSTVSGGYAQAFGASHFLAGNDSTAFGQAASDHSNIGANCTASGKLVVQGDAQACTYTLRSITTSTTATRLTADGLTVAAGCHNSLAVGIGIIVGADITVVARDTTITGAWAQWRVVNGSLVRDSSGTTYNGPTPTQTSAGAGSSATLTIGADTSNACLSITFTAPNADTWHAVASVRTAEAS
jgi:hypothetical protein